jgi:hypothetical protein
MKPVPHPIDVQPIDGDKSDDKEGGHFPEPTETGVILRVGVTDTGDDMEHDDDVKTINDLRQQSSSGYEDDEYNKDIDKGDVEPISVNTEPSPPFPPSPPSTPPGDLVNEQEEISIDFEDLNPVTPKNSLDGGLKEFDMDVAFDKMDSITLRNPSDVYYDIYREARAKAKNSRKSSLQSYIEAQNIRNAHNLDVMNESSDDEYEKQLYGIADE